MKKQSSIYSMANATLPSVVRKLILHLFKVGILYIYCHILFIELEFNFTLHIFAVFR